MEELVNFIIDSQEDINLKNDFYNKRSCKYTTESLRNHIKSELIFIKH